MDIGKTVESYSKIYRKALGAGDDPRFDAAIASYGKRLAEMYDSEAFEKYSTYPSTNTVHVFAVIAMCLELKCFGLSDPEIIDLVNDGFSSRRELAKRLARIIDKLPNAYEIAERWNISDHGKRVQDGSLTYDYFDVSDGKIEYRISKCIYVEMFELYGIRSLCKIFCLTDETAYANLSSSIEFIRHSDLSDGDCCHDEIIRRR